MQEGPRLTVSYQKASNAPDAAAPGAGPPRQPWCRPIGRPATSRSCSAASPPRCRTSRGRSWWWTNRSPDGTAALARRIAANDPRLRIIRRVGRRGLSTACVEGALATAAPFVAVMDADLQHDETRLGPMLARLRQGDVEIVVATRYADGGSLGEWGAGRRAISRWAGRLSRLMLRAELSDPMSGFFMARREVFDDNAARLSGRGFKILLDLFASAATPLRFAEIPYRFGLRQHGESKLDRRVALDFLAMLFDKTIGRFIPLRFVLFAGVGGSGILVHMLVLWLFVRALPIGFAPAMVAATLAAMVSNFVLNNAVTWSGTCVARRLLGGGRTSAVPVRHRRDGQYRRRHRAGGAARRLWLAGQPAR